MGWEDEHAVELLIEEAKGMIGDDDYEEMLKASELAAEAAESLNPRNLKLEFEGLFFVAISLHMLNKFSRCFAVCTRLIAMSENPALDMAGNDKLITLTYSCCAESALRLAVVSDEALRISEAGLARCRQMNDTRGLLDGGHYHTQLQLSRGEYNDALIYAEQLVAEKKLSDHSHNGCDLDCYQKVYAQSLAYASSLQAGITYLDALLLEPQQSYKLWELRARLNFRAGDFQAALSDSDSAMLIEEEESTQLLKAFAHAMLAQDDEAINVLSSLCAKSPGNETCALWYSLFSSDLNRLQRFIDSKTWEGNIIRYFLGDLSFDDLILLSEQEDNPAISLGEAHCFAGLQAARQGKKNESVASYGQCLNHSHFMSDCYVWADANYRKAH